jgi:hypothetical protein
MTVPSSPVPIEVALYFVQQLPSDYQQTILDWLLRNKAEASSAPKRLPLRRGAGKHLIAYIAPDFDAPLNDFNDYM